VGATAHISEAWLMPVLEAMLTQFPFRIRGFHSDNGLNASEKFEVSAEEVCSTQGMRAVGEISSSKGRVPEVVFQEVRDPAHHNEHKIGAGAQP
jgi:hypothetical protein